MSFLKIKNCIFKTITELFVFDKEKRTRLKSRWAKKHLKKYVDFALNNLSNEDTSSNNSDIIWQYWQQGVENAPKLIKKCLESTKKYHPDKKIIILDIKTVKDYVELPKRYYDLLEKKKISSAHFSDIVRTYLLYKYGGVWVDSTIYFTGKIPNDIFEADFFALSKSPIEDRLENKISNFFLAAKPKNKTIEAIKIALDKYWEENSFVINYFMYEHIATMLSDSKILKDEWDKMPYYDVNASGALQRIMNDEYDSEKYAEITSKTNIHKLSYKKIKEVTSGNTYYDRIIS